MTAKDFSAPGDQVEVERWDGHLNTLSATAASTLDLPLILSLFHPGCDWFRHGLITRWRGVRGPGCPRAMPSQRELTGTG